jgi:hypothetical protein
MCSLFGFARKILFITRKEMKARDGKLAEMSNACGIY